jgi:hypothetical protein
MCSLTLMSKGEKRVSVPLLPSMPKGEIVGMFYSQHILVIDGKYNNNDGLSTRRMCQAGTRNILGRRSRASLIRSKEIVQSMHVCH